jgi:hypothetical protein
MKAKLAKELNECANEGARMLAMGGLTSVEWAHRSIDLLHKAAEALHKPEEKSSGPFVIGKGQAGGHTVKNK